MASTSRQLDPEALRRHIGFVPQETFLFSATLAREHRVRRARRDARKRFAALPRSPGSGRYRWLSQTGMDRWWESAG